MADRLSAEADPAFLRALEDGCVAALAEARYGAGQGRGIVFYVTVGTGVGATGGGVAGAAIGAVGGPIGAAVGLETDERAQRAVFGLVAGVYLEAGAIAGVMRRGLVLGIRQQVFPERRGAKEIDAMLAFGPCGGSGDRHDVAIR